MADLYAICETEEEDLAREDGHGALRRIGGRLGRVHVTRVRRRLPGGLQEPRAGARHPRPRVRRR